MPKIELIIPVSSKIAIHEYVLIKKLSHCGSITSITRIFCACGLVLEIKYDTGYAIIKQMTVAKKAKQIERRNTSRYAACAKLAIF